MLCNTPKIISRFFRRINRIITIFVYINYTNILHFKTACLYPAVNFLIPITINIYQALPQQKAVCELIKKQGSVRKLICQRIYWMNKD